MSETLVLNGVVGRGYGVCSGQAKDSPYPAGSLVLQKPFFLERGLDLSAFFSGSLNVSIAPYHWKISKASHTFRQVNWFKELSEDFSFIACRLGVQDVWHDAMVYYPHPETKPDHFLEDTVIEVMAAPLAGIGYGSAVRLEFAPGLIEVWE